jgi:hypothetical protein
LLYAGEAGQQLTDGCPDWNFGGYPAWESGRNQALWYNALKIFAELLRLNNQQQDAELVN